MGISRHIFPSWPQYSGSPRISRHIRAKKWITIHTGLAKNGCLPRRLLNILQFKFVVYFYPSSSGFSDSNLTANMLIPCGLIDCYCNSNGFPLPSPLGTFDCMWSSSLSCMAFLRLRISSENHQFSFLAFRGAHPLCVPGNFWIANADHSAFFTWEGLTFQEDEEVLAT